MTPEQIEAVRKHQAEMLAFAATEGGKLLAHFESAVSYYWALDGQDRASDKQLRDADAKVRTTRDALVAWMKRVQP